MARLSLGAGFGSRSWRAWILAAWLLGGIAVEAATAEPPPQLPSRDFSGQRAYRVVRVVAWHTIVVDVDGGESQIRLLGIRTPETARAAGETEGYSSQATHFAENLLSGESVYLDADRQVQTEQDEKLAYVYRAPDGLFVNLELIRQGYGHVDAAHEFRHLELFRYYERKAKDARKGTWSTDEWSSAFPGRPADAPKSPPKDAGPKDSERVAGPQEAVVYATRTGTKYHTEKCSYAKQGTAVPLSEAKQRGLTPCSRCRPPE